ncbi:DUF2937 family protein [Rhodovibrio salinarum]|uniref:DUF2937 family protein n=1 Tax=Rhodovibrio salinarum TaxID=1087 RepID=UPI0004B403B5|nr:DUF2937 family protein [Rhodovibrio salinarum]
MFARLANGLFAAAGAASAAQFPAFYQQYLQHLSGRLAQARDDLAPVIQDAQARGLSVSDYLDRAATEGGELTGTLVAGYRSTYQAFERLQAAHQALTDAGPLDRPLALARHLDMQIVEGTLHGFAPALPLTVEGGGYALAGLLLGLLAVWTLERPALAVRRRRHVRRLRRQTADAASRIAPLGPAEGTRREPRLLPARTPAAESALDPGQAAPAQHTTHTPRDASAKTPTLNARQEKTRT